MYQGRIVDIVDPKRATPQLLGMLMGGSSLEQAAAPTAGAAAAPAAPSEGPPS
jgi:hypothetical protein